MSITIRKPYRDRPKQKTVKYGKSQTQQALVRETDINAIMRRAYKTGQMPVPQHDLKAQYGDFTQVADYQTAQNQIILANQAFEKLPAHIRKRFDNNPAELLDFLANPDNAAEALQLGIVERPPSDDMAPKHGEGETTGSEPAPSSSDTSTEGAIGAA